MPLDFICVDTHRDGKDAGPTPAAGADAVTLGGHWQEIAAEGRNFQHHGKLPLADKYLTKATGMAGCGWIPFNYNAECRLQRLDTAGALQDTVMAGDVYKETYKQENPGVAEEEICMPKGPLNTAGRALWMEAELEEAMLLTVRLRADPGAPAALRQRQGAIAEEIRRALGPESERVLREDLMRAMLREEGDPDTSKIGSRKRLGEASQKMLLRSAKGRKGSLPPPLPLPPCEDSFAWQNEQKEEGTNEEEEEEEGEADEEVPVDPPWKEGYMKQVEGHEHVCPDHILAEVVAKRAQARSIGALQEDREYLTKMQELSHMDCEFDAKLKDTESEQVPSWTKAVKMRQNQKWDDPDNNKDMSKEATEHSDIWDESHRQVLRVICPTLELMRNIIDASLRKHPRYLTPPIRRGPSKEMRLRKLQGRRKNVDFLVRFLSRRALECLMDGINGKSRSGFRNAAQISQRLVGILDSTPCSFFPYRYRAISRALDLGATAARRSKNFKLAIEMQKRRCQIAMDHGLTQVYTRALDELALLLFTEQEYQLAEAAWQDRLKLVQAAEMEEQTVQVLLQLARCFFAMGLISVSGYKKKMKAGGSNRPEMVSTNSLDLKKVNIPWINFLANLAHEDTKDKKDVEFNYDAKPNTVEACLRIILHMLDTKDLFGEYAHLVQMERFPDPADREPSGYPLMPPDFDEENNLVNSGEGVSREQFFTDTCQALICDITGISRPRPEDAEGDKTEDGMQSETAEETETEGDTGAESSAEPEPGPEPEPEAEAEAEPPASPEPPPEE